MNPARTAIEVPRARQVSLLLTTLALVLWSISILQAELVIDGWGLINGLPMTYFISLALLTIASAILWVSPQNHGRLLCFQLCFFILALWLTPLLIGGSTVFGNSLWWTYDQWTMPLRLDGHLSAYTVWYHNWPGFDILLATMIEILGLENVDAMFMIVSVPMQFLILLLLYLFFRNLLGRSNYVWAAAWLFFLGNWTGQARFCYQGLGFLMLLTMLVLFTRPSAWGRGIQAAAYRFQAILAFACLIISHLLSSVAGLFVTVGLYAARRISGANLVIMFAVFLMAWAIYGSWHYLWATLPDFLGMAFRIDLLWQGNIAEPVARGSEAHVVVTKLRIVLTALFGVIAAGGLLLSLRFKDRGDIIALAIGAGCLFVGLPFAVYGGETLERIFLFVLPVLAYFGVKLLKTRVTAIILVILLIISLPLFFLCNYGNQPIDYMSPGDRAYRGFLHDRAVVSNISGGYDPGYFKTDQGYVLNFFVYTFDLEWDGELLITRQTGKPLVRPLKPGLPHYVSPSRLEQAYQEHLFSKPQFVPEMRSRLDKSPYYNLIYMNPDNTLYLRERVE